MNIKLTHERAEFFRQVFDDTKHWYRKTGSGWIAIPIGGKMSNSDLCDLIKESYHLSFPKPPPARKKRPAELWPWPENLYRDVLKENFVELPNDALQAVDYVFSNFLPLRESKILRMFYFELKGITAISKEFYVSKERIRQIHLKGLRKLKKTKCIDHLLNHTEKAKEEAHMEKMKQAAIHNPTEPIHVIAKDLNRSFLSIEELDLSVRAYNCLTRSEISNLAILEEKTVNDLLGIRNMGRKTVAEVVLKAVKYGIYFFDEDAEAMETVLVSKNDKPLPDAIKTITEDISTPMRLGFFDTRKDIPQNQIVPKESFIYTMSPNNQPVLYSNPHVMIRFEANDVFHGQFDGIADGTVSLDRRKLHPASGPVYINGAEPGDILLVRIRKIRTGENGVIVGGVNESHSGSSLECYTLKNVIVKEKDVLYKEFEHYSNSYNFINKIKALGIVGVAPKEGAIACGLPGLHGGGIGFKRMQEATAILLPVYVPSALLSLGCVHAVVGDGGIGVSGVEVSAIVDVTVNIIKNKTIPVPLVIGRSHVITIASHEDINTAAHMAVENMITYLMEYESYSKEDAVMMTSTVADISVSRVFGPIKTVRLEYPIKHILRNNRSHKRFIPAIKEWMDDNYGMSISTTL